MAMLTADEPLGLAPEKGAIPRRRLLVPLVIVVVGLGAWAGYLSRKYPTASPLTSTAYLVQQIGHPHAQMQRQVIGFLPYWQQDDSKFVPLNLLSEVVFFALTADDHGQIVTEKDGKPEPGLALVTHAQWDCQDSDCRQQVRAVSCTAGWCPARRAPADIKVGNGASVSPVPLGTNWLRLAFLV